MNGDSHAYRRDLSYAELVLEIERLLAHKRAAERLVCRYLADLADRIDERRFDVTGFVDIHQAARCLFSLGVRATRDRLRVGRALRELPAIEQAFLDGRISYGRVREVTRVASAGDEHQWLALACELPMRVLEQRVAEAGGGRGRDRTSEPATITWKSPETLELRLNLRAETWALLQRAMEGARRAAGQDDILSDDEALVALAKDALAHQAADIESAAVHRTVVLYECRTCQRVELETGAGPIELADGTAAALGCGAVIRDLRTEGRIEQRGGTLPSSVARAVHLRDRSRCRVPGCSRRRYVDVHHIREQARGGVHSRKNCLCLCDTHHRMLHERKLAIEGDAEGHIEFRDASGAVLVDPFAAPSGARRSAHSDTTQVGSSSEVLPMLADDGARLLMAMGERGGWDVDALCEATGMGASAVVVALLPLELRGRVRRDFVGAYRAT